MSLLGRWDRWYRNLEEPAPYGGVATYLMGAEWLQDCDTVEDWGCGKGWFRQYIKTNYRGIDGSGSPFCDEVVDLETYRSTVDGVFLRHVLEHNENWPAVLANAAASAQKRLVIVLFTPLVETTHTIAWNPEQGCPDIAFNIDDIAEPLCDAGFLVSSQTLESATQYGVETIIRCER